MTINLDRDFFLDKNKMTVFMDAIVRGKTVAKAHEQAVDGIRYDAIINGEYHELECETLENCKEYIDNEFEEMCQDADLTEQEETMIIVKYYEDDLADNGKQVLEKIPYDVTYERTKSDHDEHFRQADYV